MSVVTLPDWKRTALGSPIALFSSHPLEEQARLKPILLMGGIHGDEPEGVRLANDTLAWIKDTVAKNTHTLAPWIVIPCLNIDGFAKRERVNGRGVDLNRNYPSSDWSPVHEKPRYFPGPHPASESEVQAVVDLITSVKPRLVIHCHSWKPCIVGAGEWGDADTARLSRNSGYEARGEIGYPTPGSLSQYGWLDNKIPIICIEENDETKDLDTIWPRFSTAMREIFTDLSLRDGKGASK